MERRRTPRYGCAGTVEATLPGDRTGKRPRTLSGQVINLSSSGACISADRLVERLTVLSLKFRLPGVPVQLPVLAEVLWIASCHSKKDPLRLGLVFIF